ncbi:MAG: hypothetical protein Q3971_03145 [Moraxella sp.]|nr:hypothetical protein [Moraxella sp.]
MLIYSKHGAVVDGVVGRYRNPIYFERVESTDKVMIYGDYPHIKEAYELAGVEVVEAQEPTKHADDDGDNGGGAGQTPKPKRITKTTKEPE